MGSGAPPPPAARPLGGLPGPSTHWLWMPGGAGVGTCHQPHSALLRAGSARCGGGKRAPGGGASCLGVGRPGSGALPAPPARPVGGLPGPTTHWLWVRGCAGVGTRHQPHSARSCVLWGWHEGARGGRLLPGCGVPGSGVLPPPAAGPLGGLPGPTTHWLWVRGGAGVGTRHQLHSARSCVLWGRHESARGGRLLPGCGACGVGPSPTPDCPPSGRAAGAHYPLAVGAAGCGRGDLSPTPQRALLRAGFARCWGATRAPGGGASCLGVGRPGSGALPSPTARPLGGPLGPTTHWLWMRGGAGVGTRHQLHSARSCVLWGWHEHARGGRLLLGVGRPGSGVLPPPAAGPLGGLPGPTTHWLWVRGGAGVGTRQQPHSARSCELALSAVGAARGRPGGAPLAWVLGVLGRALSHPRLPALWAGCRGPLPTGCGCGGVRAWGPVTNPTARALASWLCALWGRQEGARGGRLLPGCVASGVMRSPIPDCPPSGRAAGAHYPLAVGAGECGPGDPSPTPQRALLRGVGAA